MGARKTDDASFTTLVNHRARATRLLAVPGAVVQDTDRRLPVISRYCRELPQDLALNWRVLAKYRPRTAAISS